jgi:hypothetical protein
MTSSSILTIFNDNAILKFIMPDLMVRENKHGIVFILSPTQPTIYTWIML